MPNFVVQSITSLCIIMTAVALEVAGGWLIWKWRVEHKKLWLMPLGCVLMISSGIVATFQKQAFNRTYATYGGLFIGTSFLWGWALDKQRPDLWDGLGCSITVVGVLLIMFGPRKTSSSAP
ncbi:hypothetical protein KP509_35G017900 [Ceratopteris richardii]|uniref:Uncharacterized protein n=1 Tax=Ceratopteris richardii TaxID=49495 RepID=A0A8T2QDR1_CERRI|nr:hypothetical protein KP509_35G017900 [Ceratopteris richardii]